MLVSPPSSNVSYQLYKPLRRCLYKRKRYGSKRLPHRIYTITIDKRKLYYFVIKTSPNEATTPWVYLKPYDGVYYNCFLEAALAMYKNLRALCK